MRVVVRLAVFVVLAASCTQRPATQLVAGDCLHLVVDAGTHLNRGFVLELPGGTELGGLSGAVDVQVVDGGVLVQSQGEASFRICHAPSVDQSDCSASFCSEGRLVLTDFEVHPRSVHFATTLPLMVSNQPIDVTSLTDDPSDIGVTSMGSTAFGSATRLIRLQPRETRRFSLVFAPRFVGEETGALEIRSSAASISLPLSGYGGGVDLVLNNGAQQFDAGIVTYNFPRLGEKRFLTVFNRAPGGQDGRGLSPQRASIPSRMAPGRACVRPGTTDPVGVLRGLAGPLAALEPDAGTRLMYEVLGDFFGPAECPVEFQLGGRWLPLLFAVNIVQIEPCAFSMSPRSFSSSTGPVYRTSIVSDRYQVSNCHLSWLRLDNEDAGLTVVAPEVATLMPGESLEIQILATSDAGALSNSVLVDANVPGGVWEFPITIGP